jgi:hypothetical protein
MKEIFLRNKGNHQSIIFKVFVAQSYQKFLQDFQCKSKFGDIQVPHIVTTILKLTKLHTVVQFAFSAGLLEP